jgi:Protein of unknown function (DUF2924)
VNPLDEQLEVIAGLTSHELKAEWRRVFNAPPSAAFSADMLRLGLAYDIQARKSGRLPVNIARHIARQSRQTAAVTPIAGLLPTGTRLVRDWHKVSHHVLVTETGYLYRDRHFDSLSAIAREITGVTWSGPRFFGLRAKRRKAAHA